MKLLEVLKNPDEERLRYNYKFYDVGGVEDKYEFKNFEGTHFENVAAAEKYKKKIKARTLKLQYTDKV